MQDLEKIVEKQLIHGKIQNLLEFSIFTCLVTAVVLLVVYITTHTAGFLQNAISIIMG